MVKSVVQVLLDSNTKYTIYRDKIAIICFHSELFLLPDTGPCSLHSPQNKKVKKILLGGKTEGQETSQTWENASNS